MRSKHYKHINVRLGNSDEDIAVWAIIHQHRGFPTISDYVRAAVLEYDKQHHIRPEALHATSAAVDAAREKARAMEQRTLEGLLDILNR